MINQYDNTQEVSTGLINLLNDLRISQDEASSKLEITYINPNLNSWNKISSQENRRKRLYRRNVPGYHRKLIDDSSLLLKQNFLAKLDWYKRQNCKRIKSYGKYDEASTKRLWNVYSAPSREWMMSGDCSDSLKVRRRRDNSQGFLVSLPIITNSGNRRWLEVSLKDVEDIVKNLKTKNCFRVKHLIFQRNRHYCDDQ